MGALIKYWEIGLSFGLLALLVSMILGYLIDATIIGFWIGIFIGIFASFWGWLIFKKATFRLFEQGWLNGLILGLLVVFLSYISLNILCGISILTFEVDKVFNEHLLDSMALLFSPVISLLTLGIPYPFGALLGSFWGVQISRQ